MTFLKINAVSSRKWLLTVILALVIGLAMQANPAHALDLNMVSVGVATFKNNYANKLGSTHKDAMGMTKLFQAQKGKLFNQVNVTQLLNEQATSGNIVAALQRLRPKANANTYTIFFVASHGGTNNGKYSFCAHDQTVSWDAIQSALSGLPGKVIVILDTCGSGGVTYGGNMIVFSACLSTQLSGEDSANGYFTKCFLEALSGKADFNKDGKVTLAEIDAYVSDKLDTYNKGKQLKDHQQCTLLRPANVPSNMPVAFVTGTGSTGTGSTGTGTGTAAKGVTWSGKETLQGFGKLSFVFQNGANNKGGPVTMTDVSKSYSGTWSMQGNTITISIPSVGTTYTGTMNGNTISGQGYEAASKKQWTFSVAKGQ